MYIIKSNNADQALYYGLNFIGQYHIKQDSRNGPVIRCDQPVTSVYRRPRNRVLFNPVRNCNPFLHLFESLWMLNGCNDVAFPAMIAKQMWEYSDDGITLNGAYGHRWRRHFGIDQIDFVINELRNDPGSRRAHIQMWDGKQDVELLTGKGSKDVPCNHAIDFEILDGRLNMVVYNRSNDLVWGAYGANIVHFSFLQEYIACALDVEVGTYHQVSRNLHLYTENPVAKALINADGTGWVASIEEDDSYENGTVDTSPVLFQPQDKDAFDADLQTLFFKFLMSIGKEPLEQVAAPYFIELGNNEWKSTFFQKIVKPMALAYGLYRSDKLEEAMDSLASTMNEDLIPYDWLLNSYQWIDRIQGKRNAKKAG